MVIYVARCKSVEQAIAVKNKLSTFCTSLIHDRVLQDSYELDAYSVDFLKIQTDEWSLELSHEIAFREDSKMYETIRKWLKKGYVVVLAICDDGIEDERQLPKEVKLTLQAA